MDDGLKSLIAELESAKEGSRALGEAVSLAAGWKHVDGPFGPVLHLEECSGREEDCNCVWRNPTLSLDAALTLVPENWFWDASNNPKTGGFARLTDIPAIGDSMKEVKSFASTPALAMCGAALKARDKA